MRFLLTTSYLETDYLFSNEKPKMSKLVDKEYLRNMNAECVHNEHSYITSNVIEVKILPYLEFPKKRY